MTDKIYHPWAKDACHLCGTEFLVTRGYPRMLKAGEKLLCPTCENAIRAALGKGE